jgi:hypothetical protein
MPTFSFAANVGSKSEPSATTPSSPKKLESDALISKADGGLMKSAPAAARRDWCGKHLALSDLEPAHSGWSYWTILAAVEWDSTGNPMRIIEEQSCVDRNM